MMEKISLMPMTLFMRILFKFNLDHDLEDLQDGYQEMLDLVADAGFHAVDITSWEVGILGIEFIMNQLMSHGLKVSSFICPDNYAAMDEEGFVARIEKAKKCVDAAKALGTDVFMIVPQAQEGIEEYTPEQMKSRMIAHFLPITNYARENGMHVVIEDTPDIKLHLCKAADVRGVLDEVPGLELVYDCGNPILVDEDPIAYLEAFKNDLGYIHLKDMRIAPPGSMMVDLSEDGTPMSSAPTGTGLINLTAVMKKIKEIGYEGRMTVEFFVDDDREYLKSLIRTKEYVENLMTLF